LKIGDKVCVRLDKTYSSLQYANGTLIAVNGEWCVVLNETFASEHSHLNPFITTRLDLIEELIEHNTCQLTEELPKQTA
jgi:hypothetical protein